MTTNMREDFLHYLWRQASFDLRHLRTTEDAPLTIQQFGVHNTDAGPDFDDARLRIQGLQWAGKVEMHVNSSEWYQHGHEEDPAYDGVILHVVLTEDVVVFRRDGSRIPCLELKGRIPVGIRDTYWRMTHNAYWIPCQNQLDGVGAAVRNTWLKHLLAERLERRSLVFAKQLHTTKRDWEGTFYRSVARAMGGKVNGEAMEMLAAAVPLRILLRHQHSLLQLEALFFGQSGLLPSAEDLVDEPYVTRLQREYALLSVKYELRPLPTAAWRFLRMRPNNFPTVRIAQLACLYHRGGQLFGKALAAAKVTELRNMFDVTLSNYWRDHYRFGPATNDRSERRLGSVTIDGILINAVVTAYYTFGKLRDEDAYRERAIQLLEDLPAESNSIVSSWRKLGWRAYSSAESQALLELKRHYCEASRCTTCSIGCAILKRAKDGEAPLLTIQEETYVYRVAG